MVGGANEVHEEFRSLTENNGRHVQWLLFDQSARIDINDDVCDVNSSSDSIASSSSSSSSSYGPLYELSDLLEQLPIKRGLSKHYKGKSQSFGCLASAKSLEDLAKKTYSSCFYSKKKLLKPCKSYGTGLVENFTRTKATITKKKPSFLYL